MTDDRIDVGTALKLVNGERPIATCPKDDEPLVSTVRFRGAEFFCMCCGTKYGFLSPKPATSTPELQARHDVLKAAFKAICDKVDRAAADYEEQVQKLREMVDASDVTGLAERLLALGASDDGTPDA